MRARFFRGLAWADLIVGTLAAGFMLTGAAQGLGPGAGWLYLLLAATNALVAWIAGYEVLREGAAE